MMISSRKEAIYWITAHMVPNIVGAIRFTYGFHRTGSEEGIILDMWLGAECIANVCSDIAVSLLLWKAESTHGAAVDTAQMLPVLRAFVVWNTAALLFCCAGNLAGLRYPPKWVTLVVVWTPVITFAALCKIYYTAQLYRFYRTYKDTDGKAFDGASMVAARSVRAEGDRTSIVHTPDDVTAPNLSKSMEGTTLTTKSQTFGVKSHRLSGAAEDHTSTIQPRGTKSGKIGNRSRRQSVASKSRTTPFQPPRTKSGKFGDRSRRHSGAAEERTSTLLPPGKKYGKSGGRSRRHSVASEASAGVAANAAKPPGGKSKGQAVGASGRGTVGTASTTRKPAIRESRRSSVLAAGGTQKDGKKSQRPSGTYAVDARAAPETIRKAETRSRRQSVTDGGGSTQHPSSAGSTPPLQTSRRQSAAGLAAVAAAQLAAQNRARRKSLIGTDATGVGAAFTPRKST